MPETLRYSRVIAAVRDTPWAILPEKLHDILAFLNIKAQGGSIDAEVLAELRAAARERPKLRANGDIAVLPLVGTISQRIDMMSEMSGGVTVEAFTKEFRALLNDPTVAAIVLDVDSPGGTVTGIEELSTEIFKARGIKPISAVANSLAASAAYWIASAADELAVSPSAIVGSIGVIAAHEDWSAADAMAGVKTTLITAGQYKAEGNPFEPLSDEARATIQKRVDEAYGMFTKAVARNRGVSVETVRTGFGEGRVVGAKEAVSLGMADRVATLDDVIATVGRRRVSASVDQPAALLPTQTFEDQCETALTAVASLHARARALTALRVNDGRVPLSKHAIPTIRETCDALTAIATDLDGLLAASMPIDQDRVAALQYDLIAMQARQLGVPV